MKKNPSLIKNPAQPVYNVSIIDAMIFCNQLSIRDGLEPVYLIEGSSTVSVDNFASGYRLATSDEWLYALDKIENMGDFAEYVYDGDWDLAYVNYRQTTAAMYWCSGCAERGRYRTIKINEGISEYDGKNYLELRGVYTEEGHTWAAVAPAIRLIRPIFDYWKYTSGE